MKKTKKLTLNDFEEVYYIDTETYSYYKEEDGYKRIYQDIYLIGIKDDYNNFLFLHNVEAFWEWVNNLDKNKKIAFVFYNAPYDLPHLYKHETSIKKHQITLELKKTDKQTLLQGTINNHISIVDLWNFNKLWSLRLVPELVEKLEIKNTSGVNKLSIEYEKFDLKIEGSNYIFTDSEYSKWYTVPIKEELDYLKNDLLLTHDMRKIIEQLVDKMYMLTDTNGYYTINRSLPSVAYDIVKQNIYKQNENIFTSYYDKLNLRGYSSNKDILTKIEGWYAGGFTAYNKTIPYYKGEIEYLDVNSMYPFQLATKRMPVGGILTKKPKEPHLVLVEIKNLQFEYFDKYKVFSRPFFTQLNNTNYSNHYLAFEEELNFAKKYGLVKYTFIRYWYIKTETYTNNTYKTLYTQKQQSTGVKSQIWKLVLNSSSGKLGEKLKEETNVTFCNLKTNYKIEDDIQTKFKKWGEMVIVASWMCFQARKMILETIDLIGVDNFLYCDTDSVIFKINDYTKIQMLNMNIGNELGQWKSERQNKKLVEYYSVLKAKKYLLVFEDNSFKLASSGIDKKFLHKLSIDNLKQIYNYKNNFLFVKGKKANNKDKQYNTTNIYSADVEFNAGIKITHKIYTNGFIERIEYD